MRLVIFSEVTTDINVSWMSYCVLWQIITNVFKEPAVSIFTSLKMEPVGSTKMLITVYQAT
jgi:hypothetical protein